MGSCCDKIMGNAEIKERFEMANKTKILSAADLDLSNWEKLLERFQKSSGIRNVTLARNKFKGALPLPIMCDNFFKSLKVLDLSFNDIENISCLSPISANKACEYPPNTSIVDAAVAGFGAGYPLDTLNLSGNKISALPPLLLMRFPQLKVLNLSKNKIDLQFSYAENIFLGANSLATLDLSSNCITTFKVCFDERLPKSLQKLQELMLGTNQLNLFSLDNVRLGALRQIDVSNQRVSALNIDPCVFSLCPMLNRLDYEGVPNQKKILDELKMNDDYKQWQEKHADVINKQLQGGADTKLMK